ncbi:MAG: hypothetical protein LM577_05495 [Thermoproteaceae archaeon]|nr:hypothetical protein [Thermoproteaceae archaeon]
MISQQPWQLPSGRARRVARDISAAAPPRSVITYLSEFLCSFSLVVAEAV